MKQYKTVTIEFIQDVCYVNFIINDKINTITSELIFEMENIIRYCDNQVNIRVLVLQGSKNSFCSGADFNEIMKIKPDKKEYFKMAEALYRVWLKLSHSRFISIAHVEGIAKAGGMGFVAACDIVISNSTAEYSLSELLFGVYPACVLPFLQRRIGRQRSHYLILSTRPINPQVAYEWGLVDAVNQDSKALLRHHLIRLTKLDPKGVEEYKKYSEILNGSLEPLANIAATENSEIFSKTNFYEKINFYKDGME